MHGYNLARRSQFERFKYVFNIINQHIIMKKLFALFIVILITPVVYSQAPQKMSYQCVVRNNSDELVTNQAIGMKISILQGSVTGEVVFSETYNPNLKTNANGLVTVEIGSGTSTVGDLSTINWGSGTFYLKTETDPAGGTNYTIVGTSQLLSVPYALYAYKAANAFSGEWTEITGKPVFASVATSGSYNDLLSKPSLFDGTWTSLSGKPTFAAVATTGTFASLLSKPTTLAGYGITDADNSVTNEIQTISIAGSALSLSQGGGTIAIPGDNWGTQTAVTDATLAGNGTASTPLKVADNAITSAKIADASIAAADLANSSITTEKLATNTVTTDKIANNNITVAKLPSGAASDKYLRGDGTWATPASAIINETDPTWNGVANETVNIGRTGNVGIGTITPSARLEVAGGDALINEMTVGKGGGSQLSNTAIGYSAFSSNTSGIFNTAVGNAVMNNNTGGSGNSAFGFRALFTNTTGDHNTAMGIQALFFNTSGYFNTAAGDQALYFNTMGVHNTAVGALTLSLNTEGYENSAVGMEALHRNTTGSSNNAFGAKALSSNTFGSSNTAIGYKSGYSSNIDLIGDKNTFVGANTDYYNGNITNSTAIGANVILTHSNTVILGKDANVGIGTTNPAHKLDVTGIANLNKGIASGVALRCNGAEALWFDGTYFSWGHDASYNYFADPVTIGTAGTPSYTLVVNGTAAKTDGGNWSVLSDSRMKDLTGNYEKGLKEILDLKAVRFTYKDLNPRHLDSDEEQIGFIAQDVQKIFPEAVNQCKDGYLDFNMHAVNVAMVNAIRELKAENDRLKAENEQFNSRLTKLEAIFETVSVKLF
jgi:hypothetical protein